LSSTILNKIKGPIEEDLRKFEGHFRNAMKSHVPLLDKIMHYIVQKKGKQVRPMLVFLSAKTCGEINDSTFTAASLIELVHTASLVHDDVVDDSSMRRGAFSINALWKNKIAVIVGDYLLTKGLFIALDNDEYEQLKILSSAVKDLTEGEMLQLEKARRLDIKEDIYFDIIKQKTASLIAASCKAGAVSSTGTNFIGKPRGIDIKEKKMTLPLIYALSKAESKDRRRFIRYIKRDSKNSKKGIEYAQEKMLEYKDKAIQELKIIPESPAKESLLALVDYIVERNI